MSLTDPVTSLPPLLDVAQATGLGVATVWRILNGLEAPSAGQCARLSPFVPGLTPGPAERADAAVQARAFIAAHPDIRHVDIVVHDTSGVFRGKRVPIHEAVDIIENGIKLVGSIYGLDIHGENVEETGLSMATGDRDQIAVPVTGALHPVLWSKAPTAQLLMTMLAEDGSPFFACPRQVLAGVVARFAGLGLTPVVAAELEFYLIDTERTVEGGPQPPRDPATGRRSWATQVLSLDDLDRHARVLAGMEEALTAQEVPAQGALSEYAPSQFEINLHHTADACAAADHAVLFKRAVRGVARAHGVDATFMAKPYGDLSGSGLHIHVSLVDGQGRNVFSEGVEGGAKLLRHAVGGLIEAMPESIAVLAPNANSYRRFKLGSYAPVAPSWGFENRTVSLRVPGGDGAARRIEHRVAGADANPYLVIAAVLAGIHHGLATQGDPGPPLEGNAYDKMPASLPRHWGSALEAYDDGLILPRYFGEAYHQHYGRLKRAEFERYEAEVSALDHAWYLDHL